MALSRDKILHTAYEVLAAYGLADLSMRRLASELQVAPGALYYHVQSKQHLLVMLSEYILERAPQQLHTPCTEGSVAVVRSCLMRRGELLFSSLYPIRECPEVIRLALTLHPESVIPVCAISEDLRLLGFSREQALRRARLLTHLVLSLIEEAQTLPLLNPAGEYTYDQVFSKYKQDLCCAVDSLVAL
ncbi:MAG: helix-turn-helix domain-containing protein [Rothia sp. (in: high G+C Gram-positive bacteria)]|uniref:TetR/AcrR family transcriptional regulator n=1 Tax=Rothia sp. (in: high G+C Gram-positive bacteria) TaxID=1885016 RepID=UPI0026DD488C|nr:helix-turn-helix domain-containing protein [Rothia sp. (in: high G+C Gram-positive bacteria)]MDO4884898.1 helix-turn-helix domain-containing protein [Rothia sp. (in: high G+C Gram-positive bacteria)]